MINQKFEEALHGSVTTKLENGDTIYSVAIYAYGKELIVQFKDEAKMAAFVSSVKDVELRFVMNDIDGFEPDA